MESKSSLLEETCSSLKLFLESLRNESGDYWKSKYEENISKLELAEQQVTDLNLKLREANNKIVQLEEEKIQLVESEKEEIATLEGAMDVRERELKLFLKSNHEQRKKMVQSLQSLVDIEKN